MILDDQSFNLRNNAKAPGISIIPAQTSVFSLSVLVCAFKFSALKVYSWYYLIYLLLLNNPVKRPLPTLFHRFWRFLLICVKLRGQQQGLKSPWVIEHAQM